ncbi:J domain-containing protein [Leptospira ilyithenensis]|uniref:Molecular chaperone DnaJ n=1 Tax=Leptospira ilyithenensis TaxID=2484901 RepID=A0A4R9LTH9_9LEPT|nr:DnaJ domain-containing protein [Leptospira ilyithenensis]TGN13415.1 molecular chaperone DnaJ [Leptospira ilyithenensis]
MDKELLLDEALSFLGLNRFSTEDDLKVNYHKLAKKYHPDTGEFTSEVLFQELQKNYEYLKKYFESNKSFGQIYAEKKKDLVRSEKSNPIPSDPIFVVYKKAKEEETKAILNYFEKTKLSPLNLDEAKNNSLVELRAKLDPVCKIYLDIVKNHPNSLWVKDSKSSLDRLSVWWKQNPS